MDRPGGTVPVIRSVVGAGPAIQRRSVMQQTRPAVIIIIIIALLVTGCSRVEDVTSNPAYGNFSDVTGTWKTKIPMRLAEIEGRLLILSGPQFVPEQNLVHWPAATETRDEHR